MKRLLLVEDEEVILKALRKLLERNHYEVHSATTVEQALAAQPQTFDLVLADLRLPGAEGPSIIPHAEAVPVVIMTSHASVRSAVDAMRHGAIDYIAKPFDHDELLMVIERALMQNLLKAQNLALKLDVQRNQPDLQSTHEPVIEHLLKSMNNLADNRRFLHLHGERGSEREALARTIHAHSDRHQAPFVVADVGADTGQLNARLLLGNDPGTPLENLPPGGLLQAAQNGTLVLRNPELLSAELQLQLSNAISEGTLSHPDNGYQRTINVRVITVSHDTIEILEQRQFLTSELANLLRACQFEVPPLRQRTADIAPIAKAHLNALAHRHGLTRLKFSAEAASALQANHWPGNVAELRHVISRAVYIARGSTLSAVDLGFAVTANTTRDLNLDEYFRYFVLRNQSALSETDLAARLGISRKALWERRQKMKLPKELNEDLSSSENDDN